MSATASPVPMSMMFSYDSTGNTRTLPSPMRPVRATPTIRRTISSTRTSSTHKVISTSEGTPGNTRYCRTGRDSSSAAHSL